MRTKLVEPESLFLSESLFLAFIDSVYYSRQSSTSFSGLFTWRWEKPWERCWPESSTVGNYVHTVHWLFDYSRNNRKWISQCNFHSVSLLLWKIRLRCYKKHAVELREFSLACIEAEVFLDDTIRWFKQETYFLCDFDKYSTSLFISIHSQGSLEIVGKEKDLTKVTLTQTYISLFCVFNDS